MRTTLRFGIIATTALMLGAAGVAIAQAPGPGSMPGMRTEEKKEAPIGDEPHGRMEMPDPMERPIPDEGAPRATETKGSQPLPFKVVNGVKVFELTAKPVRWLILPQFKSLPDIWATTWSYNGQIPGPMIRVTQGDRIRVLFKNELPDPALPHPPSRDQR